MNNVQRRIIHAERGAAARVIDTLAEPSQTIWPSRWPPLVLSDGLNVGSAGGHATIRYRAVGYEPGQSVRFAFADEVGLIGWHDLRLAPAGEGQVELIHTIRARTSGRMIVLWPLMVRWLHEALVRDMFDVAELQLTGTLAAGPSRWSRWVRLLRWLRRTASQKGTSHPPER